MFSGIVGVIDREGLQFPSGSISKTEMTRDRNKDS